MWMWADIHPQRDMLVWKVLHSSFWLILVWWEKTGKTIEILCGITLATSFTIKDTILSTVPHRSGRWVIHPSRGSKNLNYISGRIEFSNWLSPDRHSTQMTDTTYQLKICRKCCLQHTYSNIGIGHIDLLTKRKISEKFQSLHTNAHDSLATTMWMKQYNT